MSTNNNMFLNGLQNTFNYTYTENGAITRKTSGSDLLDLFAQGAAMRKRSEDDCINLFKNAYIENSVYALKCLFYLRDILKGQGERRFFRVCYRWLISYDKEAALRNLSYTSRYGRWDDLIYITDGTSLWNDAMQKITAQFEWVNSIEMTELDSTECGVVFVPEHCVDDVTKENLG